MAGLTQEQEQEVNRDKKVQDYLNFNQTIVDGYLPLKNKQTALNLALGELNSIIPNKLPVTTGITTTKNNQKKAVGNFYESVCGVCRSYLLDKEDVAAADNLKFTRAKIVAIPDNDVISTIEGINKLITDVLLPEPDFSDYGITALTLADGFQLAKDFNISIALAPAQDAVKTGAGEAIEGQINLIKEIVEGAELLVRNFITTNPDFYNGFQAANKIDDIGVHHTGIRGETETATGALKEVVITCVQLNKTTKSDLTGHYDLIKMKAGTYEFTATHPAHPTQTKVIKLKRGRIIEVDWLF